jgi:hypothetical protein
VQVRHGEGVASHIGPEPCAGIREDVGEASVGEHTERKATWTGATSQALVQPGGVVEPGMCARSLYGNREISGLTSRCIGLARIGKARSRSR